MTITLNGVWDDSLDQLLTTELHWLGRGGPGKPTGSNPSRAPRSDPTQRLTGAHLDVADSWGHGSWRISYPPPARRRRADSSSREVQGGNARATGGRFFNAAAPLLS
jgi:hypothetical protein